MDTLWLVMKRRPASVLIFLSCFHTMLYGIGFFFEVPEFRNTLLYYDVSNAFGPALFGAALILSAILGVVFLTNKKVRLLDYAMTFQAIVWLFAGLAYALGGHYILALAIGIGWATVAWYSNIMYKHRKDWTHVLDRPSSDW
jgi:hypothetical protein